MTHPSQAARPASLAIAQRLAHNALLIGQAGGKDTVYTATARRAARASTTGGPRAALAVWLAALLDNGTSVESLRAVGFDDEQVADALRVVPEVR